ncbi:glutamate cyclase domain-containing protein [Saccharopolyspora phatthalungensis]|uniref:D-glutamate cyclase-like C-terminal domain-containing protein n=1 Tax=Saccharopolyspora phatthalungensis TaxID=664693 RepID=A0A840QKE6_9PSEU|nr:glutamate cyclase domain-containing protein [Saccharopolyspora phatthalungensis]MBB5159835.1 hypothetical protein [Saccharopolyspora phatthalungensis]
MPKILAENIDRIITTELRPTGTLPRGVTGRLYEAARQRSKDPLCYVMAAELKDCVRSGDRVVIVTGAGGPPYMPSGEIDGLLGSTALARILAIGLDADVHIVVEERFTAPMTAVLRAGELNVRDGSPWPGSVALHVSPEGLTQSEDFSGRLLGELDPSAVIAIEKIGVNSKGVIHGVTGLPWTDVHFNAKPLFDGARASGARTFGIGDGGNEVGWGGVTEVAEIMPHGRVCQCGCGGGIACAVETDILVHAAISNWGGYGVAAMLGYLLRRPDLVPDADYVERILTTAAASGAVCGWYSRPMLSDDGVPLKAHRAIATMLKTAVEQAHIEFAESSSH